jgi:hypothetical protein
MPAPIVAGAIVAAKVVGPIVAKWAVAKIFTGASKPKEWNDFNLFLKDSVRAFADQTSANQRMGFYDEIGGAHPLRVLYKPQGNEYLPLEIAKQYKEHWKKNWASKNDKWARNRRKFINKVWADLNKYIGEYEKQIKSYSSEQNLAQSTQPHVPGASPVNNIQPVSSQGIAASGVTEAKVSPYAIAGLGVLALVGLIVFFFKR